MIKKIGLITLLLSLTFAYGCEKLGITKSNVEEKKSNFVEILKENNQTATAFQQEIAMLEGENERLKTILTENEGIIKNLQGQLATATASAQTMQAEIDAVNKSKKIICVIAAISLIFNALFLWMIFGKKKRDSTLALPPARGSGKKDIDILKYAPDATETEVEKEENVDSLQKAKEVSDKQTKATPPPAKKVVKKAKKTDSTPKTDENEG